MIVEVQGFVIDGSKEPGVILSVKFPTGEYHTGLSFASFSWSDESTLVVDFADGKQLVIRVTEKETDPKIVGSEPGQTRYSFSGTAEVED